MGKGNFRPQQNRHPSTDHQQICHRWLRRRPLWLCRIRCISVQGGFWAHGRNITKIIFMPPFLMNSPTGQTRRRIFTHDNSNDADSRKDVPFGGIFHTASHLGGQKPQNKNFWAWIGVFKPNSRNRTTCILSKLLHRFQLNFAQWIKTTKCPSWVVPTHALQMQDGRHLGKIEKLLYLSRDASDFDEIWYDDAVRPSWASRPLKIWNFKNTRRRRPPSWKV